MSFDIFFCWTKNKRLDFDDVQMWTKGTEYFTRSDAQLWYSNPQTGVYFSFDFAAEAAESPDDDPLMPEGYLDSGLSFHLNYNRPRFFAFEAMPVVARLASRFELSVVDPQATGDEPELMRVTDSEALVRSWLNHNERATRMLVQEPDFPTPSQMSAASSVYLWRYSKAKEDLERACGEEIFVPRLVPFRRRGSTQAGTAFTYSEGLPMIVPDSEWVILIMKKKGLSFNKRGQKIAVISARTFVEVLADYIKPYDYPEPQVRIIGAEFAEAAGKIVRNIERTLPRAEFDVIERDAFVDIQIPTSS